MDFRTIKEEYNSIYKTAPQYLSEETEDLELIDEEYEAELDALVDEDLLEEVVLELLDEGLTGDQIVEAYEELVEARITSDAGRTGGGGKVTSGSGSRMAAASRLSRMKSAQKIARAKERKEKVKSAVNKVKDTARKAVDEPARKYAEKRGVVKSKSGKTSLGGGSGIGSVKFKQKTSVGRREVRKAVAKDIGDRAKAKAARGAKKAGSAAKTAGLAAVGAGVAAGKAAKGAASSAKKAAVKKAASAAVSGYAAAKSVKDKATDVKNRAKQGIKNRIAQAKRNVKGAVGKAVRKVADKAGGVASRMGEETNYDLVLKYLYIEGYVETLEEAEVIMVNLSTEDVQAILEDC